MPDERRVLTIVVVAGVGSALIGLADAVHPLPVAWTLLRAGLGAVLVVALVALLVRRLVRRRGRGDATSSSTRRRRAR